MSLFPKSCTRCLAAASFSGGGFRHGPFESVGPDARLVIFLPEGQTFALMEGLGREAARLGARVVCVTDADLPEAANLKVVHIQPVVCHSHEDLFPLLVSGTLPRMLHYLAKAKGFEAGNFRYGTKVTTRE